MDLRDPIDWIDWIDQIGRIDCRDWMDQIDQMIRWIDRITEKRYLLSINQPKAFFLLSFLKTTVESH